MSFDVTDDHVQYHRPRLVEKGARENKREYRKENERKRKTERDVVVADAGAE